MSPVSLFLMFPGLCVYVSQMDRPLPSSFHAPSIWYDDVPTPQKKPFGNWRLIEGWAAGFSCDCARAVSGSDREQLAAAPSEADAAAFAKSRREMCLDMVCFSLSKDATRRMRMIRSGRFK